MDKRRRAPSGPQKSRYTPVRRNHGDPVSNPNPPTRSHSGATRAVTSVNRRKSVPTMDRHSMLVMEANEITQLLKKHFEFEMKQEVAGDDSQTQVLVRNTSTRHVCVWTLAKMKERLQTLRKLMYADEVVGQGRSCDAVFYDAADIWLPEEETPSTTDSTDGQEKKSEIMSPIPDKHTYAHQPYDSVPNGYADQHSNRSYSHSKRHDNQTGHNERHNARGYNHDDRRVGPGNHADHLSNHKASPRNHTDHPSNHHVAMETLSNETALPSVSVSVAFQSTQDAIKLPNGVSTTRPAQENGMLTTSSSELPGDSEFLRMSLASTMSSPMSPPPPPKDFGENSGGSVRGGANRAVNQNAGQASRGAFDQTALQPALTAGALPERYLTSSSAGQGRRRGSPQQQHGSGANSRCVDQSSRTVEHTGPGDPNTHPNTHPNSQPNHRPIIKTRSPHVIPPPSGFRNSPRKSKHRHGHVTASSADIGRQREPGVHNGPITAEYESRDIDNDNNQSGDKNGHSHEDIHGAKHADARNVENVDRKLKSSHRHSAKHNSKPQSTSHNENRTPDNVHVSQSRARHPRSPIQDGVRVSQIQDGGRDLRLGRKNKRMISSLRMCRDMVKTLAHRGQGSPPEDTLADRIMYNCESIKIAVINILEAYTQAQEGTIDMASFADSELVKLTSMQLVAAMELLLSHTSQLCHVTSTDHGVKDAAARITNTMRDVGKDMVLFLQACETDNDTLASDSATKIIDELYDLVSCCGQLTLCMNTCPVLLSDPHVHDLARQPREDDLLNLTPGGDVKQALVSGCDAWLCSVMQASLMNCQDCELRAQMLSEDCIASQEAGQEVAKHAYMTTTTAKILLLKCQQIQVEVCAVLRDDSHKSDTYYHQYFTRCHGLIRHVTSLVDSVAMLCQAAEPLIDEEEPGTLRKVSRCAELIHKHSTRLVSNSNHVLSHVLSTPRSSVSMDTRDDVITEACVVLSEAQSDAISRCGEDVHLATLALCAVVKRRLPSNDLSASSKIKRMLPATPGGGANLAGSGGSATGSQVSVRSGGRVKPMLRCKSAKQPERMRRSVSYHDVGKKSNEV